MSEDKAKQPEEKNQEPKIAKDTTSLLHEKLDIVGKGIDLLTHPSYQEMQKKLDEAEAKADQCYERLLRQQADIDNINRRAEREIANAHKYALEKFVMELLPIVDSLERSIEVSQSHEVVGEGVGLTYKIFISALEKFGVQQINPLNEKFNPEFHEAVSTQENADAKAGNVLSVLQKGYLLNNRLVRPALVVVAK